MQYDLDTEITQSFFNDPQVFTDLEPEFNFDHKMEKNEQGQLQYITYPGITITDGNTDTEVLNLQLTCTFTIYETPSSTDPEPFDELIDQAIATLNEEYKKLIGDNYIGTMPIDISLEDEQVMEDIEGWLKGLV